MALSVAGAVEAREASRWDGINGGRERDHARHARAELRALCRQEQRDEPAERGGEHEARGLTLRGDKEGAIAQVLDERVCRVGRQLAARAR